MLVPNANYCAFEDWVMPVLDAMADESLAPGGPSWTPSRVVARLGAEIDDDASFCTWAARNRIPVYCPAITDGSLGDMLFFHTYKRAEGTALAIDVVADVRAMNDEALKAAPRKTGVLVLGGGLPKHHAFNANLMRNGADFAVVVSTAQEYDGSDSGARPDEAVSWGKIRTDAAPVKVTADATIALPLLVSQTFAKLPAGQRRWGPGEKGPG
jgi:deoxyhypusine synthase